MNEIKLTERLYGMAEAERQIRVAQRLYAETNPTVIWSKLSKEKRRPFIDAACQQSYVNHFE